MLPEEWHSEPVRIDRMNLEGARVVKADVVAEENRYRHDSKKLADALIRLYYERNQMTDAEPAPIEAQRETQHAGVGWRAAVTVVGSALVCAQRPLWVVEDSPEGGFRCKLSCLPTETGTSAPQRAMRDGEPTPDS